MTLERLEAKHNHGIFNKLRKEELNLLNQLYICHPKSVVHSFNVATDCVYVAKKLGMSDDEVELLRIAALLHDVGKIKMLPHILYKGITLKEQKEIARYFNKNTAGVRNLLSIITLKDLIEYRSKLPFYSTRKIWNKEKILKNLGKDAEKSLLRHIREHVLATEYLLVEAGVSPRIIGIAARHHPEYDENKKVTIYTAILSIVDKFNAMIMSEGDRGYKKRLSRSEALDILVYQLKQNKQILKALSEKHLLIEAKELENALKESVKHFYIRYKLTRSWINKLLVRTFTFLRVNRLFGIVDDTEIKREFLELEEKYEKVHH